MRPSLIEVIAASCSRQEATRKWIGYLMGWLALGSESEPSNVPSLGLGLLGEMRLIQLERVAMEIKESISVPILKTWVHLFFMMLCSFLG